MRPELTGEWRLRGPAESSLPALQSTAAAYLGRKLRQSSRANRELEAFVAAQKLLIGEHDRRLFILRPEGIDYVQAEGNYVKLHVGASEYITRDTVKRLSAVLAPTCFIRIERSLLVNVASINYAQRIGGGTFAFTLFSGSCLRSGPGYSNVILRVFPLPKSPSSRVSSVD
jgi:DNA-binding LytR/AlgR family response regulator